MLWLLAGCQFFESSRERVEYLGPRAVAYGLGEEYLVLTAPVAAEVRERRAVIEEILSRTLEEDRVASSPPVFNVLHRFTIDAEAVKRDDSQTLVVDALRLRRTEWVKDYRIITEFLDDRGNVRRTSSRTESWPALVEWQGLRPVSPGAFPPPSGRNQTIFVRMDQLTGHHDLPNRLQGTAQSGRFNFSTTPFLTYAEAREEGLTIRFNNETNTFCLVDFIPAEAP